MRQRPHSKEKRTLRIGQTVLITNHPALHSLIGRTGRVVQLPMSWAESNDAKFGRTLQRQTFAGDEKSNHRVWVRLDGVEEVEYGIPFNCLLFEETDEVA